MLGNALALGHFQATTLKLVTSGKLRPATAHRHSLQASKTASSKAFSERRSSLTQRVSLAATPRPARAQATAGDRVTMIARLVCWLAIWSYLAVLSVQLFRLYAG